MVKSKLVEQDEVEEEGTVNIASPVHCFFFGSKFKNNNMRQVRIEHHGYMCIYESFELERES